jgi:hypothetical protein
MKLAIPISTSDVHMLPLFTSVLLHHGGLHNHTISLYPTEPCKAEADTAANRLRDICPSVQVHPLPDFEGGWPKAPNRHFASVAMHLHREGNREPWFWMELDTVPLEQGWADKLQGQYRASGMAFLGNIRPTPWKNESGEIYHQPNDEMMIGVGVYSPWILNNEKIKPLLLDLLKLPMSAPAQPFDIWLRWMLKRAGWAHTDSIYHAWRSRDYRWNENHLTTPLSLRFLREDGSEYNVLKPVLVHGCKDESLYNLALQRQGPVYTAPEAIVVPPAPTPEPKKPAPVVKQSTIPEPIAEAIRSRFILGPVTEEEEAGWPCTKAEFEAFLKENKKKAKRGASGSTRLRAVVDHFGFKNMDVGRRAIGHWGYEAPKPSTYLRKAKK